MNNTLRFKRVSVSVLLDIRKGGDVYNATEQFLTARGLSMRTLDRDKPRVIDGVLRDGKETQTFDVTIVRDKIGSFKERDEMQSWLQAWILKYVDGDPAHSSETTKAQKPLAAAEVIVEEVEGNPGYYTSKFFLRPHYQLEGLTVSLRLVSKLPSAKAA